MCGLELVGVRVGLCGDRYSRSIYLLYMLSIYYLYIYISALLLCYLHGDIRSGFGGMIHMLHIHIYIYRERERIERMGWNVRWDWIFI